MVYIILSLFVTWCPWHRDNNIEYIIYTIFNTLRNKRIYYLLMLYHIFFHLFLLNIYMILLLLILNTIGYIPVFKTSLFMGRPRSITRNKHQFFIIKTLIIIFLILHFYYIITFTLLNKMVLIPNFFRIINF